MDLESQLLHLRQGDPSVCHFVSGFLTLADKLQWGNAALPSICVVGLVDNIRDRMVAQKAQGTLDATTNFVLRFDQCVLLHPILIHVPSGPSRFTDPLLPVLPSATRGPWLI